MRVAILLWFTLTVLFFNGCCPEPKPCPSIPQKCRVPYTSLPDINNTICDDTDYSCITIKALSNYEAMKAYADTLLSNSAVCR